MLTVDVCIIHEIAIFTRVVDRRGHYLFVDNALVEGSDPPQLFSRYARLPETGMYPSIRSYTRRFRLHGNGLDLLLNTETE